MPHKLHQRILTLDKELNHRDAPSPPHIKSQTEINDKRGKRYGSQTGDGTIAGYAFKIKKRQGQHAQLRRNRYRKAIRHYLIYIM